jgi:calcineurin-like phosphoesterase family protein
VRFFISDAHYGHANIIDYCSRPFRTVEEMDRTMIDQWNGVVTEEDEVFFVGDFSFCGAERSIEILNELRGTKHLILGNHDYIRGKVKPFLKHHFASIESSRSLFIEPVGRTVNLCHYPSFGPKAPQILVHGHSHNYRPLVTTYTTTRQLLVNVSVECVEYTPMSETLLAGIIDQYDQFFKGDV